MGVGVLGCRQHERLRGFLEIMLLESSSPVLQISAARLTS